MNWVRAFATLFVLWAGTAWSATLTWTANKEPDLAGYRVYHCSQQPCTIASGTTSLLVTLGTVTSFNIGTPATTQYYIVTAYDFANNESIESSIAIFTPTVVPPPVTPPPVVPPPVVPPPIIQPPAVPPPVVPPPVVLPPVVPPAIIGVSPISLSFVTTLGSANPAIQTLSIGNRGGGTLSWSAGSDATWLKLSRTLGTGNGVVTVSVTTSTIAAGTYNGSITLSAVGTSPVTVPVTLIVAETPVTPPGKPHHHRSHHRRHH